MIKNTLMLLDMYERTVKKCASIKKQANPVIMGIFLALQVLGVMIGKMMQDAYNLKDTVDRLAETTLPDFLGWLHGQKAQADAGSDPHGGVAKAISHAEDIKGLISYSKQISLDISNTNAIIESIEDQLSIIKKAVEKSENQNPVTMSIIMNPVQRQLKFLEKHKSEIIAYQARFSQVSDLIKQARDIESTVGETIDDITQVGTVTLGLLSSYGKTMDRYAAAIYSHTNIYIKDIDDMMAKFSEILASVPGSQTESESTGSAVTESGTPISKDFLDDLS